MRKMYSLMPTQPGEPYSQLGSICAKAEKHGYRDFVLMYDQTEIGTYFELRAANSRNALATAFVSSCELQRAQYENQRVQFDWSCSDLLCLL